MKVMPKWLLKKALTLAMLISLVIHHTLVLRMLVLWYFDDIDVKEFTSIWVDERMVIVSLKCRSRRRLYRTHCALVVNGAE